jgi:hypothetical protein
VIRCIAPQFLGIDLIRKHDLVLKLGYTPYKFTEFTPEGSQTPYD